jgi:hypothetical protein
MRLAQLARLFGGGVIGVSAGRFFESGGMIYIAQSTNLEASTTTILLNGFKY